MTWRPQYRSSKYRHVFGKPATKENCYDGVPITRSVHDNHLCAINPHFIAVITECAGGGAFLVLSIHHVSEMPYLSLKLKIYESCRILLRITLWVKATLSVDSYNIFCSLVSSHVVLSHTLTKTCKCSLNFCQILLTSDEKCVCTHAHSSLFVGFFTVSFSERYYLMS